MIATLDRIDSTTKQFTTDVVGLIDRWPLNKQSETDRMVRYVLSDKWKAGEYAKRAVLDESQDHEKLAKLCQSLYFDSISYRETSIPKRHAATFDWIFHEPLISDDGRPLWSSFPLWLRGETPDIYWITGKPGAGKSTLVKFIAQDPRFEASLREWAAGSQLLIARFFSWTSGGNRLQKSQEGLFRTLLLEAIRQRAQLAIDIFPARWFLLQSFNGNLKLPAPTMDELRVGFRNLLSATGDKLKLALLIDGLDEFDEDHHDLVRLLRDANIEPGVKICASSRPWNIFRDAYSNNPMLQLENLTREDIKSFVQEQVQLSPGYHDFAAINPKAARKTITDIVDKSQGVFLWVSVISGLLEAGFQEGTGISDLQAAIDKLPSEVADLFRYIWNRTGKRFRAEASQYFQLMTTCQKRKTELLALTLWFGDKEVPVDLDAAEVTSTYLAGVIKSLERKLVSRTGGLLELVYPNIREPELPFHDNTQEPEQPFHVVNYMHRTANDWVCDNWASITSATAPDFEPCCWIVKGQALTAVLVTKPDAENLHGFLNWRSLFDIASLVPDDHPERRILVAALNRLDDHMVSHMAESQESPDYWVNLLRFPSRRHPDVLDLPWQIGLDDLHCTNFLDFSARWPVPAYLKQRVQDDPDLFSTADQYFRVVYNVIFSEPWFYSPLDRQDLLNFLIQENHGPWLGRIHFVKARVEHAKYTAREGEYSTRHSLTAYFTQVAHILESRIPQAAVDEDGCGAGGTTTASDPRHKTPKSKGMNEFRVSIRKMFRRKQG